MTESTLIINEVEVLTPGLRAIIVYKTVKGFAQMTGAIVLGIVLAFGLSRELGAIDETLRQHFTSGWSARMAAWIAAHLDVHFVRLGALALSADGALSLLEGWALHRRHWWGPWLVVVASGSLMPWEIYEIARHPHLGRVFLFLVNACVVLYLARRALIEHRQRR